MEKTCPRCGSTFSCTHDEHCWCMAVPLSSATLVELRQRYSDCLCKPCLEALDTESKKKFGEIK